MKVIGINGSPRKNWNSGIVLDHALEGATAAGAEVERIDLFDLNFRGCISCFACKRLGGPSYSACAQRDALTPVLEKVINADALIVSAPIYYNEVPGTVRNFYERLLFPPNHYSNETPDIGYGRRIPVGLIYTMGQPDPSGNYDTGTRDKNSFERFLGDVEVLNVCNCYQFDDYSKYASSKFDPVKKKEIRDTVFPEDCKKAYELGKRLASK